VFKKGQDVGFRTFDCAEAHAEAIADAAIGGSSYARAE